ncbi:hypothetical protein QCE73_37260 [Caballeronia sp. LZ029]|uniref:hypothetical protein n=1 Tax=Caballeronia sp. LZ029 TaxID=3038564 RepID=UPI0028662242|nr:hypothetical protein [Caballeronia sp. LZ029]MDR5748831.1 hypothetical protein [Caballeronia sp. LZ029]
MTRVIRAPVDPSLPPKSLYWIKEHVGFHWQRTCISGCEYHGGILKKSTARIVADIQRYCLAHPCARDTIEGIVWWLRMQDDEDFQCSVSEAVEWLVANGELERNQLQDGSVVFGTKPQDANNH